MEAAALHLLPDMLNAPWPAHRPTLQPLDERLLPLLASLLADGHLSKSFHRLHNSGGVACSEAAAWRQLPMPAYLALNHLSAALLSAGRPLQSICSTCSSQSRTGLICYELVWQNPDGGNKLLSAWHVLFTMQPIQAIVSNYGTCTLATSYECKRACSVIACGRLQERVISRPQQRAALQYAAGSGPLASRLQGSVRCPIWHGCWHFAVTSNWRKRVPSRQLHFWEAL